MIAAAKGRISAVAVVVKVVAEDAGAGVVDGGAVVVPKAPLPEDAIFLPPNMHLRKATNAETNREVTSLAATSLGVTTGAAARAISVARSPADSNIEDQSSGVSTIGGPKAPAPGPLVLREQSKSLFCCPVNRWRNIAASL